MKCAYSVLRFVPDPVRGEFVNVGVLVGSDATRECTVTLTRRSRRGSHLADAKVLANFWSYLRDFRSEVDSARSRHQMFSESWLRRVWQESGNLLQLTEPAPIAAQSLEAASAQLVGQFLEERRRSALGAAPTRSTAQARIRKAYADLGLKPRRHFLEKPLVRGGTHKGVFDFVVRSSHAVQLTHTWNFRVQDLPRVIEEVKAWAWTVQDIRENGGSGTVNETRFDVPREVAVNAVVVQPRSGEERAAYREAAHAFAEVDAEPVPLGEARLVAERALHDLAA